MRNFFILFLFFPLLGFSQRIDNTTSFRHINQDKYVRISYDNDYFTTTDRYYTQGINLEMVSPGLRKNPIIKTLVRLKNTHKKYGLALDHFVFTPTSIRRDTIIKNDRPFAAGLLVKTFIISIDTLRRVIQTYSLSFGIVGESAFGKGMQSVIHNWIGDIQPLGWQHQIKNERVVNYELNHEKQVLNNSYFALNTDAQIRIGNLNTKVRAGFNFRIGNFISPFENPSNNKFQLYFFNQSLINVIGYDATLQGGIFNKTSPYTIKSGDISRLTFQDNFGGVLIYKKLYLEYFQSFLSKEFRTGKSHRWGGIKIGVAF